MDSSNNKIIIRGFEDKDGFLYKPTSKIRHKVISGGILTFYTYSIADKTKIELKSNIRHFKPK